MAVPDTSGRLQNAIEVDGGDALGEVRRGAGTAEPLQVAGASGKVDTSACVIPSLTDQVPLWSGTWTDSSPATGPSPSDFCSLIGRDPC